MAFEIDNTYENPNGYEEWIHDLAKGELDSILIKNMNPADFLSIFEKYIIDYSITGGKYFDWFALMEVDDRRLIANGSAWYGHIDIDWEDVEEEEEE